MRPEPTNALRWAASDPPIGLGYATALDAIEDTRGRTVRCTPHRRTVMLRVGGWTWFCKHRSRRPNDALVEWRNLDTMESLGLGVPSRAFLATDGSRSVVAMRAVDGRPLDVAAVDAHRRNELDSLVAFARDHVGPAIRRLHDAGLVFRDLYWNHLFLARAGAAPGVTFIDVERAFTPRIRRRRWVVKDLAGLFSSWPLDDLAVPDAVLDAYDAPPDVVRDARAKAARIAAHRPRYGTN